MREVRAMVLAAGLGVRLRPLSDYVAKPLLPVAGTTLLDRAIEALTSAGVARIAVNAHHRADRIAVHLAARADAARFYLSLEPRLLGTAGALDGARAFLAAAATIVVYNGDILCDLDVAALLAAHRERRAPATLALCDWPEVNSVILGSDGRVRDVAGRAQAPASAGDRPLTFTGIACYDRAFLDRVPPGRGNLADVFVQLLRERPGAIAGFVHDGVWQDLGTLTRYLDAHRRLLGPGFVSVGGGAVVPADARLHECVVLGGAVVPRGSAWRRAVIGRGWTVCERSDEAPELALAAAAGFRPQDGAALEPITGHGSDRRFTRLRQGDRRAVLMLPAPGDPDTERYLEIAGFLYERGLGAPAVLAHDPATGAVLLEDLGENTLAALAARDPQGAAARYGRVLDRLADLQTFGAESRHVCPLAWDRRFDHDYLRWETDYFRERFLVGHAGLAAGDVADLDGEFDALAAACARQSCTLVHRDFQAENILFKDEVVRLVDVQGMRWGPAAYDAVSLLYDPYVDLPWSLREELLAGFPERLAARGGVRFADHQWRAMTLAAGLQRLLQALGAYGYLGRVKGRTDFLKHIPRALTNLRRLLDLVGRGGDSETCRSDLCPPLLPRLAAVVDVVASRMARAEEVP